MPKTCLGWEEKHETVRYLYNMYTVYDMYKDLVSIYLGSTGPLEWKITRLHQIQIGRFQF